MFKLRLKNRKCRFCCTEVKFLEHVLTPEEINVDDDKIRSILNWKRPRNVKELISFIQTCSWYRRFVENYAAEWKWTQTENETFDKLKAALTNPPILMQAVDDLPFCIKTDVSAYAMGAVLEQGRV